MVLNLDEVEADAMDESEETLSSQDNALHDPDMADEHDEEAEAEDWDPFYL
jgi:hypothetical protein